MRATRWSINAHRYQPQMVRYTVTSGVDVATGADLVHLTLVSPSPEGAKRLRIVLTAREAKELAESIAPARGQFAKWQ